MMRTFQNGNLELANLSICTTKEYDTTIFDALEIHAATTSFKSLDLEYRDEERPRIDLDSFMLRGGDWDGKHITLQFSGKLPKFQKLRIGDVEIPFTVVETGNGFLKLK